MTTPKLNAPTSPASNGSADLDMMNEWATSLCSRLDNIDLRHADIGLEWFYSFAKSKIKRAEELRAIESVDAWNVRAGDSSRQPGGATPCG